jgi:UDP-2,3-diacylglucosamine pyrophosphatase LpxH
MKVLLLLLLAITTNAYAAEFNFVVWGDSQGNPTVLSKITQQMIASQPTFAISVGDMVQDCSTPDAWINEFFIPLEGLISTTPVFIAYGNHDVKCPELIDKYFANHSSKNSYAFTYQNSRFLILNFYGAKSLVKNYLWLKRELDSSEYKQAKFHFVFIHEPAYAENWDGNKYTGSRSIRTFLEPLFQRKHVNIVFSGHVHGYEQGKKKNVYHVITGGGGGELDTQHWKNWRFMKKKHSRASFHENIRY